MWLVLGALVRWVDGVARRTAERVDAALGGRGFLAVVEMEPGTVPLERALLHGRSWLREKLYERN